MISGDDIEAFEEWDEPVEKLNKLLDNIEKELKSQEELIQYLYRKKDFKRLEVVSELYTMLYRIINGSN